MSGDGSAEFAGRAIKAAMTGGMSGDVGAECRPGCKPGGACKWTGCANAADVGAEVAACNCESMGGRFGAHRDECPQRVAFLAAVEAEERAEVAAVLAAHRVNYHHRNVGPEPVTADNLRYTSCEGCDWLGGHHDEAGWEAHLADALAPLIAERVEAAKVEAWDEGARCGYALYDMRFAYVERENPYRAAADHPTPTPSHATDAQAASKQGADHE